MQDRFQFIKVKKPENSHFSHSLHYFRFCPKTLVIELLEQALGPVGDLI